MSKISLVRKVAVIAAIFALALGALSATNVFAADETINTTTMSATDLSTNWKLQISSFNYDSTILGLIDRKLDTLSNKKPVDDVVDNEARFSSKAYKDFSFLYGKAQTIVNSHAGFDANGNVTDQVQAAQSLQQLSIYIDELSELRGSLYYQVRHLTSI